MQSEIGAHQLVRYTPMHRILSPTIDCLIATPAADHDALILSKDRDLAIIVDSKFLNVRSMPLVCYVMIGPSSD